jgi:hypothetical protein
MCKNISEVTNLTQDSTVHIREIRKKDVYHHPDDCITKPNSPRLKAIKDGALLRGGSRLFQILAAASRKDAIKKLE